jgi:MoaA/NifB/PqqE/SkfB family radical SAM enzyme
MSAPSALTVTGNATGKPPARGKSDTFCIRLWQSIRLQSNGQVLPCCIYTRGYVKQDGVPVSTDRHSLMEIWNADTLRDLRRAMVEGRRVAGCSVCYRAEAGGGISTRMSDNRVWQQDTLGEPGATVDAMMALAVDNDFRLPKLPATIEVEASNLCNLKCRMCNIRSSSRIANDPVQSKWDGIRFIPHDPLDVEIDTRKIRRATAIEDLVDELAKDTASEVKELTFVGGEPFLIREIPRLLEQLVAAGRAPTLSLLFVSNGTVVPQWLSLAARFRRVQIAISVDGYANDFEYIRFPGRWSKVAHNIELFKVIPNVIPSITTTIQIDNVLGITRLFRYLDSVEIAFNAYLLVYPAHQAVSALPASIRRVAAARLQDYAEADCHPARRAMILSLAAQIATGDERGDPVRLRDFMLFTNDLDISRGQSIRRTNPELVALLDQSGYPWLDETLHAPPDGAMQQAHRRVPAPVDPFNANTALQRELGAAVKSLRSELMQARDRLATREAQAANRGVEHEHVGHEHDRIGHELDRVRLQTDCLNHEFDRVSLEHDRARHELDRVKLEFAQAERQLADVHASRSWQVTRPVRFAGRMLRRWLPGRRSPGNPDAR